MSIFHSITPAALLDLASNPPSDPAARKAFHDAARQLVFATESISDTESRIQNSFTVLPLVKVATDLDLFNVLASDPPNDSSGSSSGDSPGWHISSLAQKTGAHPDVLHRICRYLATQALVAEVAEATYAPSRLTGLVQASGFAAGVKHNSTFITPAFAALPGWLAKNAYRAPTGSKDCAFQEGLHTEVDAFEFLMQNPEFAAATFEYMAWQKVRAKTWMNGSVEVAEEFRLDEEDVRDGRALMVDVGGGGGHQCFEFRAAFPERKGRLVVQDTDVMIPMIDAGEAKRIGLEPMVHDFLTPQPVKGAKVYYLRTVLHDWSDEKAIEILGHLCEAMAEDSVVVFDEVVIPGKGAGEKPMLYDMVMLAALGSKERCEKEWRAVLEPAGLKLRDISIYDDELCSGLIVAVRA